MSDGGRGCSHISGRVGGIVISDRRALMDCARAALNRDSVVDRPLRLTGSQHAGLTSLAVNCIHCLRNFGHDLRRLTHRATGASSAASSLCAAQPPAQLTHPTRVHSVQLKHALCQIDRQRRNLVHGPILLVSLRRLHALNLGPLLRKAVRGGWVHTIRKRPRTAAARPRGANQLARAEPTGSPATRRPITPRGFRR